MQANNSTPYKIVEKLLEQDKNYQQMIQSTYAQRGIILDAFFAKCSENDGLLQALTINKTLKQGANIENVYDIRGRIVNNLTSKCDANQLKETMKIIHQNLK